MAAAAYRDVNALRPLWDLKPEWVATTLTALLNIKWENSRYFTSYR